MEQGKKLLAVDFCAITSRYRRKQRAPSTVTIMAMESGGRSCGVKGISSSHSRIAAVLTAGGGSIPRWSASKTLDRRPAEKSTTA